MVARILGALNKEVKTIHRAAYVLAGASFLSQILALVRDRIFASMYGASVNLDLYYAAFRIPDILYVAVSALISVSVLVPLLIDKEKNGGIASAKDLINVVFTAYVWMIFVAASVLFIVAPYIIPILFPSFGNQIPELVLLTRILLISPILLGFSNIFSALVQVSQRFMVTALSPILYNVGIIFGTIFLSPEYGIRGAVYGVLIGALLHGLIQIPYLISARRIPCFKFVNPMRAFWDIRQIVLISMPRTFSLSVSEIVEFMLIIVAGTFVAGSISVFSLAWNLQSVPLSLIGVSFSVALFPALSKLYSENNLEQFRQKVIFTLRQVLFFGAIATALAVVLRAQIVRTVFGGGEFDWSDTRLTAAAFALFIISLVFQSAGLVIIRTWYAYGSTKIPLISNLIGAICTFIALGILMWIWAAFPAFKGIVEGILRVEGLGDTQVLILPLAFSIGVLVHCLLMAYMLNGVIKGYWKELRMPILEYVAGALVIGVSAYLFLNILVPYIDTTRTVGVFIHGALAGVLALGLGLAFFIGIGNLEAAHILEGLKRRRATVISENEPG